MQFDIGTNAAAGRKRIARRVFERLFSVPRRKYRLSRRIDALIVLAVVMLTGLAVFQLGLRFVVTASLPRGMYRKVDGPPARGAIVSACLPERVARFALARGYVWRGRCPGGAVPLGKLVLGVAGDTVGLSERGIVLNGQLVPNSQPRTRDSQGRMLRHYSFGTQVLPPGQIWLFSPYHPLSFDSRYFGPVSVDAVLSRLIPVWTW